MSNYRTKSLFCQHGQYNKTKINKKVMSKVQMKYSAITNKVEIQPQGLA